jgi:hypothetical protein
MSAGSGARARALSPAACVFAACVLTLVVPACRRGGDDDRDAKAAAGEPPAPAPGLVHVSPEAERLAEIETEVAAAAPFAVGVTVPCRLSPTPETPEEIEARLDFQAAKAREVRTAAELERLRGLQAREVAAAKAVQAAEADAAQAQVDARRAEAALERLGLGSDPAPPRRAADIWALAEIDEAHAAAIAPGNTASIEVESIPEVRFRGRVVALARFVKPQTRTLTGRIAVDDPKRRLRPQSLGTATIEVASRQALTVPTAALLYADAGRILFVRRPAGYERVDVQVGAETGGRSEILSGIEPGDAVVVRGAGRLWGEWLKTRPAAPVGGEEAGEDRDDPGGF